MILTRRSFSTLLTFVFFTFTALGIAQADPITLYTTGVDNTGAKLAAGAVDTHYKYVTGSTLNNTYASANPGWVPNGASSQWITLDPSGSLPQGQYTVRTTFTIDPSAGYDLSTAIINGSLYVDDRVRILINGKDIGAFPAGGGAGFLPGTLSTFVINSGFVLGTNTIDFLIDNIPAALSPIGLQVTTLTGSISKTAPPAAVPEPTTLLLFGTGLAGIATRLRKRKKD